MKVFEGFKIFFKIKKKNENCYSSSTENYNFEDINARVHLSPQYFIIVKIYEYFSVIIFFKTFRKYCFCIHCLWRLQTLKFFITLQSWRLYFLKIFKKVQPEGWMLKKPSKPLTWRFRPLPRSSLRIWALQSASWDKPILGLHNNQH